MRVENGTTLCCQSLVNLLDHMLASLCLRYDLEVQIFLLLAGLLSSIFALFLCSCIHCAELALCLDRLSLDLLGDRPKALNGGALFGAWQCRQGFRPLMLYCFQLRQFLFTRYVYVHR